MEMIFYMYFLLPVLAAGIVLWFLDSSLTKRYDESFITNLVEVCVALLIIATGEGIVLYALFANGQ